MRLASVHYYSHFVLFRNFFFLIKHSWELMKKLRFWGFDFIYGCFWVWGDVAKMD